MERADGANRLFVPEATSLREFTKISQGVTVSRDPRHSQVLTDPVALDILQMKKSFN